MTYSASAQQVLKGSANSSKSSKKAFMPNAARHFYEFGPFRIDPAKHLLSREGQAVPLSPRAFDALLFLVQNAGAPLKREAMMQAVWSYAFVEDANLTVAVSHLRKALGQNGESQEYIETIPRVGYRFVAEVREVCDDAPSLIIEKHTSSRTVIEEEIDPGSSELTTSSVPVREQYGKPRLAIFAHRKWKPAAIVFLIAVVFAGAVWVWRRSRSDRADAVVVRSIGVLPFRVISADKDTEHLGLGVADVLITRLSNIRELNVRPTSAIMGFSDSNEDSISAGRKLKVDAILEGTIFRANNRVRVTARLINVSNQSAIWTTEFEKPGQDELGVQDEIAVQLVDALALNLSGSEKDSLTKRYTDSADAYQLYARGRYEFNKRNWQGMVDAQRLFRNAIEKDPKFALAYVGLADTLATGNQAEEAIGAAEKALELDPESSTAHASRGFIQMFLEWKWRDAESSFQKSIQLNPGDATAHHWYATLLEIEGRNEEARAELQRALEIDPLSHNLLADLGQAYYFAHQYDKAKEYCRRALAIYPDFIFAHEYLSDIYLQTGEYDAAADELLKADKSNSISLSQYSQERQEKYFAANEAIYREQGIKGFFRHRLGPPDSAGGYYTQARIDAFTGYREHALQDLEQACRGRAFLLAFVKADPIFDALRGEPRYQAVVKNMGL
jgi:DNA-binding winged helix-turn-helix (wHTH) protein/TolB-like protein/cytochrome c-type biogenesis protein CcmH/NrfG